MTTKPSPQKHLFLTIAQLFLGLALISLSTHLALDGERYLAALNAGGLNEYHAFGLLVCLSFFSGIFLIAQHVLSQGGSNFGESFDSALLY
ncbi:hypothetical protein TUM22923_11480 [Polynucleobacter sp. TUM22923]|jgi:hypothetical protein|uniref:hypothetical protein n=1 Tax=Polynucleobacter sp. TUM22923 TaxID=3022126 RepID=UPI0025724400|nr:hypothetical protein [Polynucleobacter sp. TUM22923]BDX21827.1 hypothetical protein TUM22923_11480 [Polynucleobacter sp. TUM22923]